MRKLQAFTLPLELETFTLPIPPDAHILGIYETIALVAWAVFDPSKPGETAFHAFRDGDEVPDHMEFVASAQRSNGIVVMIFRNRDGVPDQKKVAAPGAKSG
ncbi:MAG TPA: hypothetical protein VNG93_01275 [Candidatus Dormibacteraeota bacterium]|nr:hypothetical protein [Candidatus Dormibacteraeota bacterium]